MKKLLSSLILGSICILQPACKNKAESVIDCVGEGLLSSLHHTADATNPKLIRFEARYSGSHTVESITWEFGDGKTSSGKSLTVDHTYAANGTYNVKAKIRIANGKSFCESNPTKSVVVN